MAEAGTLQATVTADVSTAQQAVTVATTGRLHFGFLDPGSGASRRFGSLGLKLDRPATRIRLSPAARYSVSGADGARAERYLHTLTERFGSDTALRLEVEEALPSHCGLGSGTQLALAIGAAFAELTGSDLSPQDIAAALGRGRRSGIGIGAFEAGGVVLDAGPIGTGSIPPVVSRLPFPEPWRVLLVFEPGRTAVHGSAEAEAFGALPAFDDAQCADLCRRMVMSTLPALVEQDHATFAQEIRHLQNVMGAYFAEVQGGTYLSPHVGEVLAWLEAQGVTGVGQSSWGPTGFALFATEDEARQALEEMRRRWPESSGLHFELAKGCNHGAELHAP